MADQISITPTEPPQKAASIGISFNVPEDTYNRFCEALPGHGERTIILKRLLEGWLNGSIVLSISPPKPFTS